MFKVFLIVCYASGSCQFMTGQREYADIDVCMRAATKNIKKRITATTQVTGGCTSLRGLPGGKKRTK